MFCSYNREKRWEEKTGKVVVLATVKMKEEGREDRETNAKVKVKNLNEKDCSRKRNLKSDLGERKE